MTESLDSLYLHESRATTVVVVQTVLMILATVAVILVAIHKTIRDSLWSLEAFLIMAALVRG